MRLMFATAAVALALSAPAFAAEDAKVAAEIIALTRAQWAGEMAARPATETMVSVLDDYSVFNPVTPTRIDSKATIVRMNSASAGETQLVFSEMLNPRVQVYGDTAILTYNFFGQRRDKGGVTHGDNARATRVYVRQAGQWRLAHAHFSRTAAE